MLASASYPRPFLASPTAPAADSGLPTPSHGGTVAAGTEYDYIASTPTAPAVDSVDRHGPPPAPAPRRPMSMPPPPPTTTPTTTTTNGGSTRRSDKTRTTNRILGDYTLSKTLGAGSMGKVKLAHHNLTGEKVSSV